MAEFPKLNIEARGTVIPGVARAEGESVATYWARIMQEATDSGEPVEIANRHGDVVVVMLSANRWAEVQQDLAELDERRAGTVG